MTDQQTATIRHDTLIDVLGSRVKRVEARQKDKLRKNERAKNTFQSRSAFSGERERKGKKEAGRTSKRDFER